MKAFKGRFDKNIKVNEAVVHTGLSKLECPSFTNVLIIFLLISADTVKLKQVIWSQPHSGKLVLHYVLFVIATPRFKKTETLKIIL